MRYLQQGRRAAPTDKQATLLFAAGVRTSSVEDMIADFELGQRANPAVKRAVWTSSLSFNPDDLQAGRLPPERMLEITQAFCRKLDLDQTQLVIFLHGDTDKTHVHLVANRVSNDGHTVSDNCCRWRVQVAAQELVAEFGLTPTQGNRPHLQHPERVVGEPARASAFIRQGLAYELQQATTRAELRAGLLERGVDMRESARGLSFAYAGLALKGSAVGREFSAAAIDQQLEANRIRQVEQQQLTRQQAAAEWEATRQAAEKLVATRQELVTCQAEADRLLAHDDYGGYAEQEYGRKPRLEQQQQQLEAQLAAAPAGAALLLEAESYHEAMRLQAAAIAREQEAEQARAAAAAAAAQMQAMAAAQAQAAEQTRLAEAAQRQAAEQARLAEAARAREVELARAAREKQELEQLAWYRLENQYGAGYLRLQVPEAYLAEVQRALHNRHLHLGYRWQQLAGNTITPRVEGGLVAVNVSYDKEANLVKLADALREFQRHGVALFEEPAQRATREHQTEQKRQFQREWDAGLHRPTPSRDTSQQQDKSRGL